MKTLAFAFVIAVASGCSRADRWSIATVSDQSDQEYRRLRVEIQTKGSVPWPLHLSVSALDASKNRIESSLPRWKAQQVGPSLVALTYDEPISARTKPVVFDLKVSARAHPNLYVHHTLSHN